MPKHTREQWSAWKREARDRYEFEARRWGVDSRNAEERLQAMVELIQAADRDMGRPESLPNGPEVVRYKKLTRKEMTDALRRGNRGLAGPPGQRGLRATDLAGEGWDDLVTEGYELPEYFSMLRANNAYAKVASRYGLDSPEAQRAMDRAWESECAWQAALRSLYKAAHRAQNHPSGRSTDETTFKKRLRASAMRCCERPSHPRRSQNEVRAQAYDSLDGLGELPGQRGLYADAEMTPPPPRPLVFGVDRQPTRTKARPMPTGHARSAVNTLPIGGSGGIQRGMSFGGQAIQTGNYDEAEQWPVSVDQSPVGFPSWLMYKGGNPFLVLAIPQPRGYLITVFKPNKSGLTDLGRGARLLDKSELSPGPVLTAIGHLLE